jgi:hypothetical protein
MHLGNYRPRTTLLTQLTINRPWYIYITPHTLFYGYILKEVAIKMFYMDNIKKKHPKRIKPPKALQFKGLL